MARFLSTMAAVFLVGVLVSTQAPAYQRGNRAQYSACNSWCYDHNKYPSSQRQCQAQCCKYYGPSGNDDGVYTCSVVVKSASASHQALGGGGKVAGPVSLPPKAILPKSSP